MAYIPQRTCIVCRKPFDKKDLLRIVKTKNGDIYFDSTNKADGRGTYVCTCQSCIDKLCAKKILNKVFKQEVSNETYTSVKEYYERRKG